MRRAEIDENGEPFINIKPFAFHSEKEFNLQATDEKELYNVMIDRIEEEIQKVEEAEGTGWNFLRGVCLELHTVEWVPLSGSSYIELPEYLKNKKAITNMKNDDNKCFLWCVLRALNPKPKNAEKLDNNLKEKENTLNMKEIAYPVSLLDINKFEKQNETIIITVFGYNEWDKVYPLRKSEYSNRSCKIKLLLIEKDGVTHYCLINDISRLVASQISKHKGKCLICDNCLNHFPTEESLENHKEYCDTNECIKINMPKKGSLLKFTNYRNSEMVPFVIYADMESLLEPIQSCEPNQAKSYTEKFQKHKPISFSYYIKCFDDNLFSREPRTYTGLDAPQKFVESLEKDIKEIANIPELGRIYKKGDLERYKAATQCWICKGEFNDKPNEKGYKPNKKVWDHCHFTGRFRGAACHLCNLRYSKPDFIPVIFHNLSGYDSHLFIKNLGFTEGNIDCIPNNDEKYISFSKEVTVGTYQKKALDGEGNIYYEQKPIKHKIRFIDSFKFMSTGLNSLVSNLPEDGFNNLKKYYTGNKLSLLKRKGLYPYEYMDSLERLMENKLPPKKSFYSKLTGEGISDEDYQHGLTVWKEFEIKTMKDYLELYNETDVLLLADVFENFRAICLENYKLDSAHYFTTPGLTWDAASKVTGINLELLSDIDMLLMIEKGIRGGVSMISNRYSKANNKYTEFNPSEPSKYFQYLDANNLYGGAMSMKLPTHGFKWMNDKELLVWGKFPCILEVDLEYPDHLHDSHNDYPLAPERITCKNKVDKLMPNLRNKEKYVVHYKNLKQYLSIGLRLTRIHRGIKFVESEWLKPYIKMNTELRTKAKNNFEKDFFKLMNNAVFGKTMENIRKRVDVKLVNNREKAKKLVAKPNFNHLNIFLRGTYSYTHEENQFNV